MSWDRRPRLRTAALCLVAVAATACSTTQPAGVESTTETPSSTASPAPSAAAPASAVASTRCTSTIAGMGLRDKLASLLVVGVTGPADALRVVRDQHVGGIFLQSSTDQSIYADGRLRSIARSGPRPVLVTIDQEGGRVSRLADLGIDSPSARDLARTSTPAEVRAIARRTGEGMKRLGITVDLAPDADVSDQPDDTVIGDRSFSDDPATVARYAAAFANGLRDAGIMPVFKHFPGHGHGSGDSHTGTVRTPPLSQLRTDDLVPYRTLLPGPEGPPATGVMVGHLIVPGLTGDELPASISPAAMRMLRTGVGYGGRPYDGPIFTDDLSGMAAISARFGITEAVVRAIEAGADLALWLTTSAVPSVLDGLTAAVRSGRITTARVDDSVERVLRTTGAC
ncbi:glycoside hydrolase family 3 N-terminal domain-containing protein [uncultured Williamsia sp.]|uniref:glycoside hydrolase family 3 N-terminal domain-containing protein n=1 Tax=uncultured Williamsia sp. TaxID=259311 RepID=UPI0026067FA7|nr:glycoside hydrolase family 3 N-terminal domain-containing protein [uncultured Williamsia sp.]